MRVQFPHPSNLNLIIFPWICRFELFMKVHHIPWFWSPYIVVKDDIFLQFSKICRTKNFPWRNLNIPSSVFNQWKLNNFKFLSPWALSSWRCLAYLALHLAWLFNKYDCHHHAPSFFKAKKLWNPQKDVLVPMLSLSNNFSIFFFTSACFNIGFLFIPMFNNEASCCNCTSFCLPLLGGNLLESWNNLSHELETSMKLDFKVDSYPWIAWGYSTSLFLNISNAKFLLTFTILFICLAFIRDKLNFLLCALIMYSILFLNKWYMFSWQWKIALLS